MKSLAACAAFALVLVSGASATESTIYPGVGIGKVKLGMTQAQVVHVLGEDYNGTYESSAARSIRGTARAPTAIRQP